MNAIFSFESSVNPKPVRHTNSHVLPTTDRQRLKFCLEKQLLLIFRKMKDG